MSWLLAHWQPALQWLLLSIGVLFFFVGTIGLLRFPDAFTRIHALTKADNLGLGFVILGLLVDVDSVATAVRLLLVWLLMLCASAVAGYLVANRNYAQATADDNKGVKG